MRKIILSSLLCSVSLFVKADIRPLGIDTTGVPGYQTTNINGNGITNLQASNLTGMVTNIVTNTTIYANGVGVTNLTGASQSYTNLANQALTNFVPNLSSTTFTPLLVSNANFLFFPFLSNGPGAVAVWLYPLGATNYTFGIPTNWVSPLQSNLASSGSGTNWVFTLTNGHRAKIVFESTSGVLNPNGTNSAASISFY